MRSQAQLHLKILQLPTLPLPILPKSPGVTMLDVLLRRFHRVLAEFRLAGVGSVLEVGVELCSVRRGIWHGGRCGLRFWML